MDLGHDFPAQVVLTDSAVQVIDRVREPGVTVVLGAPGSGKTALAYQLTWQKDGSPAEDRLLSAWRDDLDRRSPVEVLAGRGVRLPLRPGDVVVLDGMDELAQPPSAEQLRRWVTDPALRNGHVVITSRHLPVGRTLGQPPELDLGHPNTAIIELRWQTEELWQALMRRGVDDRQVREFLGDYMASATDSNVRLVLQALQRMLLGGPGQQPAPPISLVVDLAGRLRVAPSLTLPDTDLQLPDGSRVLARPFLTLTRSRTLWLPEADALEALINDPQVDEDALQQFFEAHPHLLARGDYDRVVAHPLLRRAEDGPLIPDFMLEPTGASADVLDLKLPSVPLLAGTKDRLRPTAKLADALAQVREYHAYFDDAAHRHDFHDRYGMRAYRPTAVVVIGRDTGLGSDPLQLRRVWTDAAGPVRVQTYDELLRNIRRLGRLSRHEHRQHVGPGSQARCRRVREPGAGQHPPIERTMPASPSPSRAPAPWPPGRAQAQRSRRRRDAAMQVREDARDRAAASFACRDFADAVQWLRHWVVHEAVLQATSAALLFAELVRDTILRHEPELAGAALDFAEHTHLSSGRELVMLRAGARIVAGDVDGGLALAGPLLVADAEHDGNLEASANLDALARFLDAAGRGDLARHYRRCSADLTWQDAPPAYAVGEQPGVCAPAPMRADPMPPQITAWCEQVLTDGVFAVPYLPYAAFDGRTDDGAEDLAAFDECCEQVERALSPLSHGSLPLFVVPVDDDSLRAFAASRGLDPDGSWAGVLWAGPRAAAGRGTPWPPEPHEVCWCGRPRLYDDCCRRWRY